MPLVGEPAEDKPAEDEPAEDGPAEDKLAEDKLAKDKPAADKLAEDKLAEDKMVEDKQGKRKLQQMEADNPAIDIVAYVYIVSKAGNVEKLWIGGNLLRGVLRILKPYCKQVPFDPLKCMAGVNVQCKKDWCVGI
jgi:hypothetical protein